MAACGSVLREEVKIGDIVSGYVNEAASVGVYVLLEPIDAILVFLEKIYIGSISLCDAVSAVFLSGRRLSLISLIGFIQPAMLGQDRISYTPSSVTLQLPPGSADACSRLG